MSWDIVLKVQEFYPFFMEFIQHIDKGPLLKFVAIGCAGALIGWMTRSTTLPQEEKVAVAVAAPPCGQSQSEMGEACDFTPDPSFMKAASLEETSQAGASVDTMAVGDCKLVFVVRTDVKMGKGKVAAQCAHAALLAYKQCARDRYSAAIQKSWERQGQPKVVLRIDDEDSLVALSKQAKRAKLITSVIYDAGRARVPARARTVLGIGPGLSTEIDELTKHLKLY